jgi:hypothetical protein
MIIRARGPAPARPAPTALLRRRASAMIRARGPAPARPALPAPRRAALPPRAAAAPPPPRQEASAPVVLLVAAATEALRALGVGARVPPPALPAGRAARPPRGDDAAVLAALRADFLERQYFVTGVVSDGIYDDDCLYADPTVAFRGRELWKRNLALLVPLLEDPAVELKELHRLPKGAVGVAADGSVQFASGGAAAPTVLFAEWRLTCSLRFLPWRPYIDLNGTTTYALHVDCNRVVAHVEGWDLSGGEALRLLFAPGDEARAAAAAAAEAAEAAAARRRAGVFGRLFRGEAGVD